MFGPERILDMLLAASRSDGVTLFDRSTPASLLARQDQRRRPSRQWSVRLRRAPVAFCRSIPCPVHSLSSGFWIPVSRVMRSPGGTMWRMLAWTLTRDGVTPGLAEGLCDRGWNSGARSQGGSLACEQYPAHLPPHCLRLRSGITFRDQRVTTPDPEFHRALLGMRTADPRRPESRARLRRPHGLRRGHPERPRTDMSDRIEEPPLHPAAMAPDALSAECEFRATRRSGPGRSEPQQGRDGGDPDAPADGHPRRGVGAAHPGREPPRGAVPAADRAGAGDPPADRAGRWGAVRPERPVAIAVPGRADRRESRARGFPRAAGRGAGCAAGRWTTTRGRRPRHWAARRRNW